MIIKNTLIGLALTSVFASNAALAQLCEENDSNVYFQVGSNGGAPHFATPEEAGIDNCSRRANSTFSRAEPRDPRPYPILWGFLYCKTPDREYGVGDIFLQCCSDGQVLKDRICVAEPVDDADKEDGCSANLSDNPCNIATGNKFRSETDVSSNGMPFTRYYSSSNLADLGMGKGWRHNYQKKLVVSGTSIFLISKSGKGEPWSKVNGAWVGDGDTNYVLNETSAGFEVVRHNSSVEKYGDKGRILSEIDSNGYETKYEYGLGGFLAKVTNHYGKSVSFKHSNRRLVSFTDSLGELYHYEYDSADNLTAVIYPDTTPDDNTDNPRKTYHYESAGFPGHLTGITDENGNRYATFAYDANGKAILSELGTTTNPVGQEKIELSYQGAN